MTFKNWRAFENSEHDHNEHEEMPSQVNKGFVEFSKKFFSWYRFEKYCVRLIL